MPGKINAIRHLPIHHWAQEHSWVACCWRNLTMMGPDFCYPITAARWLTSQFLSRHNSILTELCVIYGHLIDVVQLEYFSKTYYKSRLPLRKRNIYIGQTFGIINSKLSNPFKTISVGTERHLRWRSSWRSALIYVTRKLARNADKKSSSGS